MRIKVIKKIFLIIGVLFVMRGETITNPSTDLCMQHILNELNVNPLKICKKPSKYEVFQEKIVKSAKEFYKKHQKKIIVASVVIANIVVIGGIIFWYNKQNISDTPSSLRLPLHKKVGKFKSFFSSIIRSSQNIQFVSEEIERRFNSIEDLLETKLQPIELDYSTGIFVSNDLLNEAAEFSGLKKSVEAKPTAYFTTACPMAISTALQEKISNSEQAIIYPINEPDQPQNEQFATIIPEQDNTLLQRKLLHLEVKGNKKVIEGREGAIFLQTKKNLGNPLNIVATHQALGSLDKSSVEQHHTSFFLGTLEILDGISKVQTIIVPGIFNGIPFSNNKYTSLGMGKERSNIKSIIVCYPPIGDILPLQEEAESYALTNKTEVYVYEHLEDLISKIRENNLSS